MGYYDRSDVPLYYWLADQFATSEAYHSSLLGPTLPNLLFYFYATSCNATGNLESALDPWVTKACIDRETIFDRLAAGGHSVQVYGDQRPLALVSGAASLAKYFGVRSIAQLRQDLQSPATLAKVVFIEPNYKNGGDFPPGVDRGTQNDEHPPSNIQDGQVFVHDVVGAIMDQPALFERSVIFITWDEHGGYYDHVAPPAACPPDLHRTVEPRPATFEFDRLGFRVPFFAISPLAKKGYASTITADHTSILRFIETWTDIGALTDRDANAWPLLDMFDFDAAPRTDIPPLPSFTKSTDPTHVSRCGSDKEESSCSLP